MILAFKLALLVKKSFVVIVSHFAVRNKIIEGLGNQPENAFERKPIIAITILLSTNEYFPLNL